MKEGPMCISTISKWQYIFKYFLEGPKCLNPQSPIQCEKIKNRKLS